MSVGSPIHLYEARTGKKWKEEEMVVKKKQEKKVDPLENVDPLNFAGNLGLWLGKFLLIAVFIAGVQLIAWVSWFLTKFLWGL